MKKYKQVLILLNIKDREKLVATIISDLMKERGLAEEVIIGQVYEVIFHIYDYDPDLVISCLPRDEYSTAMFTMVKLVHQCTWVCIHAEGFFPLTDDVISQVAGTNHAPAELIDRALFWGPGVGEAVGNKLLQTGKLSDIGRIGVFGYLLYERKMLEKAEKPAIVDRIRERSAGYRKTILVVTSYVEEKIDAGWSESDKKKVRSNIYYVKKYRELILKLAERNPEILFVVKLHPVEIDRNLKDNYREIASMNNVFLVDELVQISFLFEFCDILLHYGSTTALEAYMFHVTSVGICNDSPDTQVNSLGRKNMPADVRYYLNDTDGISAYLNDPAVPGENKETERALYTYMNYLPDKPYQPSVLLMELLADLGSPQMLYTEDVCVRQALGYKSAIKRRWSFRMRMISDILFGDRKEGVRIRHWLQRYGEAVRRTRTDKISRSGKGGK